MRVRQISGQAAAFGFLLTVGTCLAAVPAHADHRSHATANADGPGRSGARIYSVAHFYRSGGLQCVPFARENTGIELIGNANTWWSNAEGVYERGAKPEVGSVLNFRATGHMRLGHVAVVSNVIDSRNIEIDHANWAGPGGISRNIDVVDVSPNNDWSAVRVGLGHTGEFGSVYPTFGFIYDRPDHGVMVANTLVSPAPTLNAALETEEVAEATDDPLPRARRYAYRHRGTQGTAFAARGHAIPSRSTAWTVRHPHTHTIGTFVRSYPFGKQRT